ncbi:MAG TPA: transposase [Blastocatellia bacterium]|nr:transposase [Blastocatellia bacterium]
MDSHLLLLSLKEIFSIMEKSCYTESVKLIAQVKLNPTKEQAKLLRQTLERANAACNAISEIAWKNETFKQFSLHKLAYAQIRERFDLSAQVTVRAIAKVADAYKLDTRMFRKFKPLAAFPFDDRILTWRTEKQFVTIWTVNGRQKIPYVCGERQKQLLESRQGESDLVYHKGNFFLLAVCEVLEPTTKEVEDALGVDFGIAQIATDSDGQSYTGAKIEAHRKRHAERRKDLQQVGTRSAHRKLRKISGKQSRYQTHQNHIISKRLVETAQRTNRAIAIEELNGVGLRTRVKKPQRARHANWSFAQLRTFLEYKSAIAGVRVIAVDPKYTSQTCSACGHCEKANRRSQSEFVCKQCGHSENADFNAAKNIRIRALSIKPMVAEQRSICSFAQYSNKPLPLGSGS